MFDYVNFECVCPRCHQKVDGFQSKEGPCELLKLEPGEVFNFYTSCKCGAWIDVSMERPKKPKWKITATRP